MDKIFRGIIIKTFRRALRQKFSRWYSSVQHSNLIPIKEPITILKEHQFKRATLGVKISSLATGLVTAGGVYLLYSQSPVSLGINNSITLINSQEPETVLRGIKSLNNSMFINRRVFSGKVSTPLGDSVISNHSNQLVAALFRATELGEPVIGYHALVWLDKLSEQPSIRQSIVSQGLVSHLAKIALGENLYDRNLQWLFASNTLLQLSKDKCLMSKLGEVERRDLKKVASKFSNKSNPLCLLFSEQFSRYIGSPTYPEGLNQELVQLLISDSIHELSPPSFHQDMVSRASLASIFALSTLGTIWCYFRWQLRSLIMNYKLRPMPRIGTHLFLWFLLDMVGQRVSTFASNEKFEFETQKLEELAHLEASYNLTGMTATSTVIKSNEYLKGLSQQPNMSLATTFSLIQNLSFGAFAVWSVSSRKYTFLPLSLALIYNHSDSAVRDYFKPLGKLFLPTPVSAGAFIQTSEE